MATDILQNNCDFNSYIAIQITDFVYGHQGIEDADSVENIFVVESIIRVQYINVSTCFGKLKNHTYKEEFRPRLTNSIIHCLFTYFFIH